MRHDRHITRTHPSNLNPRNLILAGGSGFRFRFRCRIQDSGFFRFFVVETPKNQRKPNEVRRTCNGQMFLRKDLWTGVETRGVYRYSAFHLANLLFGSAATQVPTRLPAPASEPIAFPERGRLQVGLDHVRDVATLGTTKSGESELAAAPRACPVRGGCSPFASHMPCNVCCDCWALWVARWGPNWSGTVCCTRAKGWCHSLPPLAGALVLCRTLRS